MNLFHLAKNRWARLNGDNTCWVHLHLPKTAGSSLSLALRNHFGGRGSGGIFYDRRVSLHKESLQLIAQSRFRVISGHFGQIEMERLEANQPDVRFRYFTFLREPVSRLISAYKHGLKDSWTLPKPEHITPASDPLILSGLYNTQARQLAYGYKMSDMPDNVTDERIFLRAMKTLGRCEFIGFYEQLDRDLTRLFSLIGIDKPRRLPTVNSTQQVHFQFDDQDLSSAQALTQIDLQVYNAALKMRESQTA
jgi:hypothetical protein